ncbi:MAG TPA: TetR/AcrR family transcriptional regulator [Pseudolabrys sp.]|nr:TetR/AcrR family transcriptional regulator [Pseudolabrys sp.]
MASRRRTPSAPQRRKPSDEAPVAAAAKAAVKVRDNGGPKGRSLTSGRPSFPASGERKTAAPDASNSASRKLVPSRRKSRSVARRQAILAAALDEFSQSGFAATRLDDVAVRASVAKGTIYLYFRDKESLFQELVLDMLAPLVSRIQVLGAIEIPVRVLAERMAELFVREVYETRRKDVMRLILLEGRRFPNLAEFYYREVLAPVLTAVRANLKCAVARGEAAPGLARFPQILVAPGLIAVIWSGLFDAYEPLDVRAMMETQIELLFARAGEGGAT